MIETVMTYSEFTKHISWRVLFVEMSDAVKQAEAYMAWHPDPATMPPEGRAAALGLVQLRPLLLSVCQRMNLGTAQWSDLAPHEVVQSILEAVQAVRLRVPEGMEGHA